MDFHGQSQDDGCLGCPSGTYYLLGCITFLENVVRTHPTGSGINGGHIEKQFAALAVILCGVFGSCVPKGTTSGSGGSLGIQ